LDFLSSRLVFKSSQFVLKSAKILLDTMALVANAPSTVWRDPNVMSATANSISSISQPLPLGSNNTMSGQNQSDHHNIGLHSPSSAALRHLPLPPHIPSYHQSLAQETCNKSDDDLTDIACVVCGDKSSGKHYGQFTCEGNYIY
jgi:hypothetical protein